MFTVAKALPACDEFQQPRVGQHFQEDGAEVGLLGNVHDIFLSSGFLLLGRGWKSAHYSGAQTLAEAWTYLHLPAIKQALYSEKPPLT